MLPSHSLSMSLLLLQHHQRQLLYFSRQLLRITEDTLERIIDNDWKMLAQNTCKVYVKKIDQINGAYYKYCKGIIHADCVLVEKIRNSNFVDLIKDPPIPDRRPDLITFVHKPLEVSCVQFFFTSFQYFFTVL